MGLEWGGHSNGRIPASELMRVPWALGHLLERDACLSLIEVNKAYRAEFGVDISITDSYRPYAAQERIFRQRYRPGVPQGTGDVRRWRGSLWYLIRGQYSAAVPGTSNHGWAKAVDLGGGINRFGTRQHEWMRAWADDAGWVHPYWAHDGTSRGGSDEAWHFEYPSVVRVSRPVGPSLLVPTITVPGAGPTLLIPVEDDMYDDKAHAEVMGAFSKLTAKVDQASAQAAAAHAEASVASARAAQAAQIAQAAVRSADAAHDDAAEGASIAREALRHITQGRAEGAEQTERLARRLADLQARQPRVTTRRYDRPAVESYAHLEQVARTEGLTYVDLSGVLAGIDLPAAVKPERWAGPALTGATDA